LKTNGILLIYIDIDSESDEKFFVIEVNNGYCSVPTIVFTDGRILVEFTSSEIPWKHDID